MVEMRQHRLANAGSVERAARARPEESADRLVRLDLADKHHAIVLGDSEIGGFAGPLHQFLHDDAGAVDQLAAAQERSPHAVGLDADRPQLVARVEFDHAVVFQRRQHAVGGGGGEAALRGNLAQRQAAALRDNGQDAQGPIEGLHRIGLGRPVESARPAALSFLGRFHGASFANFMERAMKKFFN
jgi:hypothetical protein